MFSDMGLLRFLLSQKTQMKRCFTLNMPDCCLNLLLLPRGRMLPEWWVFAGWSRETSLTTGRCAKTPPRGAYRALCARCAKSWLFSTTGSSVSSED